MAWPGILYALFVVEHQGGWLMRTVCRLRSTGRLSFHDPDAHGPTRIKGRRAEATRWLLPNRHWVEDGVAGDRQLES